MSVSHLSFSSSGGAGTVASLLASAQRGLGVDARIVNRIDTTLWDTPFAAPPVAIAASVDQFLVKNPHFSAPISAARDLVGGIDRSVLDSSDVIHLHGINGLARLTPLSGQYRTKRIVWTLHDMNPFTGVCHFSLGCQQFTTDCGACPATRRMFRPVAKTMLQSKKDSLGLLSNLTVVAPSRWMAQQASESQVMEGLDIRVIPNPVCDSSLEIPSTDELRRPAKVDLSLVFIAQDLEDPRKNLSMALEAFSLIRREGFTVRLTLIGRNGAQFESPGVRWTGQLSAREIRAELKHADALIQSSTAENAPLVIPEAAAQGCLPIVQQVGGMPEMVNELGVGSVFRDMPTLLDSLRTMARMPAEERVTARTAAAQKCKELYSASSVAEKYLAVYEN